MRNWMLGWIVVLFAGGFLIGCGTAPDHTIDGHYLLPNGRTVEFRDGQFFAQSATGNGGYLVDGGHLTIRLTNGHLLAGERMDATHWRIDHQDGEPIPPLDFTRINGTTASSQSAPSTAARSQSGFIPDPSTPLDRYTLLKTQADLRWVELAHRTSPPSDDELLLAFSPAYSQESDSFKKRDLAALALPVLRERLAEMRDQHYFAFAFGPRFPNDPPDALVLSALLVNPYDVTLHVFPLGLSEINCWTDLPGVSLEGNTARCMLAVPDEASARRIESERARPTTPLYSKGIVYVCITQDASGTTRPKAVVTHTRITLASFADPQFSEEGSF